MNTLAFVVPQPDDRIMGALLFQKNKKFTVYVPENDPVSADYEGQLNLRHGTWKTVEEPLVCILEPGALPSPHFVCRVLFCAWLFKKSQVYHVRTGLSYGWNASAKKFFRLAVVEHVPAPLSSFIFRSAKLREMSVAKPDGTLEVIPTVIGCAPIRNVWWERLAWTAPIQPQGPEAVKESVKKNLDLFRWCESFSGTMTSRSPLATSWSCLLRNSPACIRTIRKSSSRRPCTVSRSRRAPSGKCAPPAP